MELCSVAGKQVDQSGPSRPWWIVEPRKTFPDLVPFNEPIITRTPLKLPGHLTREGSGTHVRAEEARGVDFEAELQNLLDIHERVREARKQGLDAKFPDFDIDLPAGSGVPNRGRRQALQIKSMRFYAALQREYKDPRNNNKICGRLPWAIKSTRPTDGQRNTEHARHGEGSRHLAKTAAETAAP